MKVKVLTRLEQLDALEKPWCGLSALPGNQNYFRTLSWYRCFLQHYLTQSEELCFLTAWDGEELCAAFPLWLKESGWRSRRMKVAEFIGAPYAAIRGGISKPDRAEEAADAFASFLLKDLRSKWDMFSSWDLTLNDPLTAAFLEKMQRRGCFSESFVQSPNYVLDLNALPGSEEYFASLSYNFRRHVKRSIGRLAVAGEFCFVRARNSAQEIADGLICCDQIRAGSWKAPEKDQAFFSKFAAMLAAEDKLRLFFLCWRERMSPADVTTTQPPGAPRIECLEKAPEGFKIIAVNLLFIDQERAFFVRTHYLEDYSFCSPGTVLTWYTISSLLDNDHVKAVDFMRGDEDYKLRFNGALQQKLHFYRFVNPRLFALNHALRFEDRAKACLRPVKRLLAGRTPEQSAAAAPAGSSGKVL